MSVSVLNNKKWRLQKSLISKLDLKKIIEEVIPGISGCKNSFVIVYFSIAKCLYLIEPLTVRKKLMKNQIDVKTKDKGKF